MFNISKKARRGATALEYALVLAFVAIAVLAALRGLGGDITSAIGVIGQKTVDTATDDANFEPPVAP